MDTEIKNFYPRPVSDFISRDSEFVFNIPSFQRGYRWTSKQVTDILKDLINFADKENKSEVYYLQPLVVRGNGKEWEVLDGQQRLTTLRLIIEELKIFGRGIINSYLPYRIKYLQRKNFDFFNALPSDNIDSYYISKAIKTIKDFFKTVDPRILSNLTDIVYGLHDEKAIKFIWYAVEGKDSSEAGAISIFNRLNRGKIKLTPSELIKALLIISSEKKEKEASDSEEQTVTSMEWNDIERRFLGDDFFAFINDKNKTYDTRTDLLFNFVASMHNDKEKEKDDDFAYRWLQEIFDSKDGKQKILELWNKDIKGAYDDLLQWYADPKIYNYIGFLAYTGSGIKKIVDSLAEAKDIRKEEKGKWYKQDTLRHLQGLIKEKFNFLLKDPEIPDYLAGIEELEYEDNSGVKENIRRLLLLFNIEIYSERNLRFPFDKFLNEKWDIEHVDSQTLNQLSENKDQKNWLEYSHEVLSELGNPELNGILSNIRDTIDNYYDANAWYNKFQELYYLILDKMKSGNPVENKDSIGNLTLLDSSTNRGYGNALFPYKRKKIIEREKNGGFVPMATRDLFLKYYTASDGTSAGINRITWSENDAQAYLKEIKNTLEPVFK